MKSQLISRSQYLAALFGVLVLFGLYLTSLYSYLLFHSLAEMFSIVIACGVFLIAWNARRFMDNNYLLYVGIASLFIGGIDLLHTLAYTGMNVFPGSDTNLTAQLWIAARYVQSLSLLFAALFLRRTLKANLVFAGYAVVCSLLLASIFAGTVFPDCYVEGVGLTAFKKTSEYVISLILLASVALLLHNRREFDRSVLRLLVLSIVTAIGAELAFTLYLGAYDLPNLIGHFFKIISFYLVYKALIETGLRKPYSLLFRNLQLSQESLRQAHDGLEVKVQERTAELTEANKALRAEVIERERAEERTTHLNLVLHAIRNVNQLIVREEDRDRLIQAACENLIETRGYHNAWVALLDESGRLVTSAEAGLGEAFLPLVGRLKRGELTACGREALTQPEVVVVPDPPSTCGDCPLADKCGGRGTMTVRLEHGGAAYGLFSVSIPRHLAGDEEEQGLFGEVTGDIAFALHAIKVEEERQRAESQRDASLVALRKRTHDLDERVKELDCLYGISALAERSDLSFEEMLQGTVALIPPAWQYPEIACARVMLQGQEFVTENFRETVWKQATDIRMADEPIGALEVCYLEERPEGDEGPFLKEERYLIDAIAERLGAITQRLQAESQRDAALAALKEYSERLEEMVEERTQELRDAQEQLVRREKLAVLGQLAGGVGHELRNPLGVISNAVYYLEMVHPDADDTTKEYLHMISSEVHNADRIISDLLDYARTWLADRERIAVSELVDRALQKQPAPAGVEVTTSMAADLPQAYVDPGQIGQVLVNLLTNAYQAMPQGGQLIINAASSGRPEVSISITDTGCGISAENMKKLFEPLFTTKARGIGLGLAVSRNLVEVNGGSIEVESTEGEGSTFTVVLPTRERE